jgi:hydroxyacylglutathione hydrolase
MSSLEIVQLVLGPVATNCYLVADSSSGEAAVIDPAWDGEKIHAAAVEKGWQIGQLWYTHGHFDHFGGSAALVSFLDKPPVVGLHPDDRELWRRLGEALNYGIRFDPGPEPDLEFFDGQELKVGSLAFTIRHTPGHTAGHCIFHNKEEQLLFSGDLIFRHNVGRTDLPGASWQSLEASIRDKVYCLAGETRLLPGHGAESSVGEERQSNPHVRA